MAAVTELVSGRAPGRGAEPRHAALEALYRAHFPFVWKALRRLGVPESDLPDGTHDVFLVAFRKLADFDGAAKVTTWLYGICLKHASSRRRRAYLRREVAGDTDPADGKSSPAEALDTRQKKLLLERALSAMSLEQRAVFTLFELDGQSGEQIAELMNSSLATVYSRLRLARAEFRKVLERAERREQAQLRRHGVTP